MAGAQGVTARHEERETLKVQAGAAPQLPRVPLVLLVLTVQQHVASAMQGYHPHQSTNSSNRKRRGNGCKPKSEQGAAPPFTSRPLLCLPLPVKVKVKPPQLSVAGAQSWYSSTAVTHPTWSHAVPCQRSPRTPSTRFVVLQYKRIQQVGFKCACCPCIPA
jgi:hypothetical protein